MCQCIETLWHIKDRWGGVEPTPYPSSCLETHWKQEGRGFNPSRSRQNALKTGVEPLPFQSERGWKEWRGVVPSPFVLNCIETGRDGLNPPLPHWIGSKKGGEGLYPFQSRQNASITSREGRKGWGGIVHSPIALKHVDNKWGGVKLNLPHLRQKARAWGLKRVGRCCTLPNRIKTCPTSGNSNLALSVFGCLWLSLTGDKNQKK